MKNRSAKDQGPVEEVDPCEATIAPTSGRGMQARKEFRPDPGGYQKFPEREEFLSDRELALMTASYNKEKGLTRNPSRTGARWFLPNAIPIAMSWPTYRKARMKRACAGNAK